MAVRIQNMCLDIKKGNSKKSETFRDHHLQKNSEVELKSKCNIMSQIRLLTNEIWEMLSLWLYLRSFLLYHQRDLFNMSFKREKLTTFSFFTTLFFVQNDLKKVEWNEHEHYFVYSGLFIMVKKLIILARLRFSGPYPY